MRPVDWVDPVNIDWSIDKQYQWGPVVIDFGLTKYYVFNRVVLHVISIRLNNQLI